MGLLLFLNVKSKIAVKLARKTHENLFYRAAFFSFVEKLESWLERLNTALTQASAQSHWKYKSTENYVKIPALDLECKTPALPGPMNFSHQPGFSLSA